MISKSLTETTKIATDFTQKLLADTSRTGALVVALSGDLGSGKTAFTQAVAKILGITEVVTSPTFVIEKIYKIDTPQFEHLIHIDAYRLNNSQELKSLGFDEILANKKNLIFVEWAERVIDIVPTHHIIVRFSFVDETSREIVFEYL